MLFGAEKSFPKNVNHTLLSKRGASPGLVIIRMRSVAMMMVTVFYRTGTMVMGFEILNDVSKRSAGWIFGSLQSFGSYFVDWMGKTE